ncbi:MAG: hypothetical protein JO261_09770, partial [Alphaproteobacteria bacterium]|nr:hypothetical protein [Alphaproteobacteria bacterium]
MSLPQLAHFRARLAAFGFSPPALVLVALLVGLIALPLIARGHFAAAIAAIVISRAIAVLGRSGAPGLSAKLDPVFLASLPFGFALADPERAPVAAFLLFGFVVATAAARVGIVETLFASAAFVV